MHAGKEPHLANRNINLGTSCNKEIRQEVVIIMSFYFAPITLASVHLTVLGWDTEDLSKETEFIRYMDMERILCICRERDQDSLLLMSQITFQDCYPFKFLKVNQKLLNIIDVIYAQLAIKITHRLTHKLATALYVQCPERIATVSINLLNQGWFQLCHKVTIWH